MSVREKLHIVLATAERDLANAAVNWVNLRSGWGERAANLDRARACCGQLRTALAELDGSGSNAGVGVGIARDYCRELRAVFLQLNRTASLPFRCLEPSCSLLRIPRTTCWLPCIEGAVALPPRLETSPNDASDAPAPASDAAVRQPDAVLPAHDAARPVTRPEISLLRQAVDLLILVLAYLQYFFIDVHLQILSLPLTFPFSLPH